MSIESELYPLLAARCPRVFPDVAPLGTVTPYVTWQGLGGRTLRFLENTPADKRNTLMQINVWSATRMQAITLMRDIEDALCASASLTVNPMGEPLSTYEEDTNLYGSLQRFSIYSAR
jgi:hypothetical protein